MNEILDELKSLFATGFTTTFTTYFKGKLMSPAVDNMPILTVFPVSTGQKHHGTLRDEVVYTVGIEIYVNIRQYFDNTAGQGTQLDTLDALVNLVENRDANGDLEDKSIMGIINNNLTISSKILYTNNMRVNYEQYLSGKSLIGKATVLFDAYDRPNR